jgi:hypothetical protein
MIQPTTENKYRFNMQVSARAMGCRDRSLPQPDDSAARSISGIFEQWTALVGANRRLKQMVAQDCRCFESASQIRDLPGRLASTGDRKDDRHEALRSPSRIEQEERRP